VHAGFVRALKGLHLDNHTDLDNLHGVHVFSESTTPVGDSACSVDGNVARDETTPPGDNMKKKKKKKNTVQV
jgi:hypothetical protein